MSKSVPKNDPYATREAAKYDNPIPSREYIMRHLEHAKAPMSRTAIADALDIHGENDTEALRRRLNAMLRDGQLMRNRRGDFCLIDKMDLVRGRIIGHRDGFGFLVPDGGGDDLFLSAREMQRVLHGDRAVARISGEDRRGRKEGAIVEVLERNTRQVVGRFYFETGVGFVVPDNKRLRQDILVPDEGRFGAEHGQIVVVEILEQPTAYRQPIGRVIEILGEHMAPGMEIDVAIRSYGLPQQWSPLVESEIGGLSDVVPEAAKVGREDLRELPLVTIDGEDARDFDDAVFCERRGRGWRLLVAIADVSAYVEPAAALDADARERGNSVYFPERVIPMLPEILSNGLCSLNPEVDRLCMVCEISLTAGGKVSEYRFFEGLMRSHARLTYNKVAAMLVDGDADLRREYAALVPHLEDLYALYQVLRGARDKRGAIDFETTETRIVFGADRKIERVVPVVRNEAHKLIEECMLAANVAAADFLLTHKMPALYRVHAGPSSEKLTDLRSFLGELGLNLAGGDDPEPRHYARLLASIQDRPDTHLIQTVLLRSLSQAVYQPDNTGHFGLAYEAYAHFTSPIRRYPDLLVHRAIRHVLRGGKPKTFAYSEDDIQLIGEHCSMTERRADEATWDAINWLKCEYMLDKVGEEFDGVISGVAAFGVFVELQEIYVEGLVHVTSLSNDYYHFDAAHHRLMGERTRKIYRLGDVVRVKVMRVDLDDRKTDFELADEGTGKGARKGGGRKTGAGKKGRKDDSDKGKGRKKGGGRKRRRR
ncbi:MAG: ribonuclease R [Pseudomonadota bacterium]|nr:MAG: ribonuclease R [Pseudomonadota bacterium]